MGYRFSLLTLLFSGVITWVKTHLGKKVSGQLVKFCQFPKLM